MPSERDFSALIELADGPAAVLGMSKETVLKAPEGPEDKLGRLQVPTGIITIVTENNGLLTDVPDEGLTLNDSKDHFVVTDNKLGVKVSMR